MLFSLKNRGQYEDIAEEIKNELGLSSVKFIYKEERGLYRVKLMVDRNSVNIIRFPGNCNWIIIYMLGHGTKYTRKKLSAVDILSRHLGHSGIFLSDPEKYNRWEIIEEFGYKPVLEDLGIQHGGNSVNRLYYKPINDDRKSEEWSSPVGFINQTPDKEIFDE